MKALELIEICKTLRIECLFAITQIIKKTVKSANEQIANIEIVSKYYGEKPLGNEKLGALMKLRLEHEDANLQELADLLSGKTKYGKAHQ